MKRSIFVAAAIVFLLSAPSGALVERIYSLQEIFDQSKVIVEGKIESVDRQNKLVTATISNTLKGLCKIKRITMNIGGAQDWYGVALLKQVKEGEPIILFWDVDANRLPCLAYYHNFFFQLYGDYNPREPDKTAWNFTHIEIRMNRTYMGAVSELGKIVRDALAGRAKPPGPNPQAASYSRAEMMGLTVVRGIDVSDNPDGWEAHSPWIIEDWGNPVKAAVVDVANRGKVLKIDFAAGAKDKAAVSRMIQQDIAKPTRILFEAENQTGKPVKLAWGISTGAKFDYFESPAAEIVPGRWHYDLQVPLASANFKSAVSQWQFTSKITNPAQFSKLSLIVYEPPKSGTLLIDRVRPDLGATFVRSIALDRTMTAARSVSWADFDNDGKLDALACVETGNKLFKQAKNGEFTEVTSQAGLTGGSRSAAWCDYDGDGLIDLVFSTPALWKNENGKFSNQSGLLPQIPAANSDSIAWMDANGDGRPDILIGRRESGVVLLLNQGNGFKNTSSDFGLGTKAPFADRGNLVFAADFDADGFTDLLTTNGRGVLARNEDGVIFNRFASPKFEFAADQKPGAAFADFDNDGDFDVLIPQPEKGMLFRNNNDSTFTNTVDYSGMLDQVLNTARAAAWGDANGDGNLDLVLAYPDSPALLLPGDGKGKFASSPFALSFEFAAGASGLSFADFDNDGDLDLLICGAKGVGILVNAQPKIPLENGGTLALKVVLPATQAGAIVRLRDSADRYAGLRQPGLPSNINSQEPNIAHFAVPRGEYKLSLLMTNGELIEQKVKMTDKNETVHAGKNPHQF